MIIVAVEKLFDTSKQTLDLIKQMSFSSGIRTQTILADKKVLYRNNQKRPLRYYVDELREKNKCDLLIIELNGEHIKKQIYEQLDFHIAVLFHKNCMKRKKQHKVLHANQQLLEKIGSHYYIMPCEYKMRKDNTITYGWSEEAHVSATSAKVGVNGELELQCCVGRQIATLKGTQVASKEFSISSSYQNMEALLAATTTMVLSGIDIGFYEKNNISV